MIEDNELEAEEQSETGKDVQYIARVLKEAHKFGVEAEVVSWALFGLKGNPAMTVREAIDYGYMEWVK